MTDSARQSSDDSSNGLRGDLVYLLGEYSTWIGIVAIIGTIAGILALWQFQIKLPSIPSWGELPTSAQLAVVTVPGAAITTLLLYAVLKALGCVDWLAQPDWIHVYEVDMARERAERDGTAEPVEYLQHYKFGPELWSNRVIREGNSYDAQSADGEVMCARRVEVDEDEKSIELWGPWMAEETDVAMLAEKQKIEANRGKIREWAVYGQNLHAKLPSVVQAIESAYWRAMTQEDLDDQALHPDIVRSHVSDDIEAFVESVETPGESTSSGDNDDEEAGESSVDGQQLMNQMLEAEDLSPPDSGGDGR
ncbi:hypothetical protein B4589_009865 [Halolamina sp. CBA1230]|uniref:hypothetical protein n=1 Tax=Halolamina sp. CBA1230 TaxID=1853690 RepID=UPI00117B63A0|nr:hypothetical protein [Halolamina sp. CBA1230]QKY20670.1 hypothetical protein B4589_009865 [Halolamina sp. CBA1230]